MNSVRNFTDLIPVKTSQNEIQPEISRDSILTTVSIISSTSVTYPQVIPPIFPTPAPPTVLQPVSQPDTPLSVSPTIVPIASDIKISVREETKTNYCKKCIESNIVGDIVFLLIIIILIPILFLVVICWGIFDKTARKSKYFYAVALIFSLWASGTFWAIFSLKVLK